ncbi:MAG TPA: two-component regulator propeller domain-containing protein [Bryobacteraceae bacterium]|nr:two-component regulator propeller domain-containing protein [Bryobacteraceae bacterium]
MRRIWASLLIAGAFSYVYGLDPHKALTQYSRTVWTQQQGLPQNSIRAIAQTPDGFLWLGTDEGLARFDGYEFFTFNKDNSGLPSNSITSLAASADGFLWIGTPKGLAVYDGKAFRTYTHRNGLADDSIGSLFSDHTGAVWVVAAGNLSRIENGRVINYRPEKDVPMEGVRGVTEDNARHILVAGWSAVARLRKGKFFPVIDASVLKDNLPLDIQTDHTGGIWIVGTRGLFQRSADGRTRTYRAREGLSDAFGISSVLEDRDGNIWVGTDKGLARLEGGRFRTRVEPGEQPRVSVNCLFEDREGDLWIGSSIGLIRLQDNVFTVYGKPEGLVSDKADTVYQDHRGRIWAGFVNGGMTVVSGRGAKPVAFGPDMPHGRVFSIHETREGELLVSAREGLFRLKEGRARIFVPPDPLGRKSVYDALEGPDGTIWLALPDGLGEIRGGSFRILIPAGATRDKYPITLAEARDGSLWVGTEGKGLWHVTDDNPGGGKTQLYTTAEGLSSDSVRSIYEDPDGTLWIGTLGGGLNALRNGKFTSFTAKDGLASDNIFKLIDDGDSLWLSTSRGICRISKGQLRDFADHRIRQLHAMNYGLGDGLRSAESPMLGGGGERNSDGSLWFPTNRGIAVYQPNAPRRPALPPMTHIVEMMADGRPVDWTDSPRLSPNSGPQQIRYTAIHLSAPYRVQYSYKLDGLDSNWVRAGGRRSVNYSGLRHGHYRFQVKAELPNGASNLASFEFTLLPHYYETAWFRALSGMLLGTMVWGIYRMRVRSVSARFASVLEERTRLAREVHDTLSQAFVGIASQLDVVESYMPSEDSPGRSSLELARRMAQHSLTEARRSVADLRAAALDNQDLAGALESGARLWTAGWGVEVHVDVHGDASSLPEDAAHHVLRIAQEAVSNALKHAHAKSIVLSLNVEPKRLDLSVADDGCGFNAEGMFSTANPNFGLMGMRERAERLGGQFSLESEPGAGTRVKVTVPLDLKPPAYVRGPVRPKS